MFPWQQAAQQQIRRLYLGSAGNTDDIIHVDESPIDADIIHADASPIDADIIHADESPIDADIIHADESPIDADIIHADESPTDVAILEKNGSESSCSLKHFVHLSNSKTWFKRNSNEVNHT